MSRTEKNISPVEHEKSAGPPDWTRRMANRLVRAPMLRPVQYFVCAKDPKTFQKAGDDLIAHLTDVADRPPLPPMTIEAPEGYLGDAGLHFFTNLSKRIKSERPEAGSGDILPVFVRDISGSFANESINYGRATHDFIQTPLEHPGSELLPMFHGDPDNDPTTPHLAILYHLGMGAGEEAFDAGVKDIIAGEFRDGVVFADEV